MGYELQQSDIRNLAMRLNAETHTKGNELFFKYCPYCHGGGKDKDTFSINMETGQFKCFRASCGKQGHFVQMARDFNFPLEFTQDGRAKKYRKLPHKVIEVRPPAIAYMDGRGIGREVVERYQITTRKDNDNILVFPFLDETGAMQFVKYRKSDFNPERDKNKEWAEKSTKPILFGMFQCVDFGALTITEGQIDSLSLAQAGIPNAVSVPTGAMGFTWLEHCWDWITKFGEVVVFGDCEDGKITLVDELSKRLPMPVRVVQVDDYLGEKDANAILLKYGPQALVDAVIKAQIQPITHIKELADVESKDLEGMPHIKTGIPEIDRIIGGFYFGQVVLLTGRRGEGKSTFMGQMIVEALDQGYKTLAYSGELNDYHFKRWLDFQAAGPSCVDTNINEYGDEVYTLAQSTIDKINEWYRGRAFIYDNDVVDDDELESLLVTVEKAICRYDIKFVCLDNLMTAMDLDAKEDLYQAQSRFVHKLKQLAQKHDVVILLVAHPRKTQNAVATADDVGGSGDITNRVDVGISYARPAGADTHNQNKPNGLAAIIKNRINGRLTRKDEEIELLYNPKTKRIISFNKPSNKIYSWENNHFVEIPETEDLPF